MGMRCEGTLGGTADSFDNEEDVNLVDFAEKVALKFEEHGFLEKVAAFFGMRLVFFTWEEVRESALALQRQVQKNFRIDSRAVTSTVMRKAAMYTLGKLLRKAGAITRSTRIALGRTNKEAYKVCIPFFIILFTSRSLSNPFFLFSRLL